MRRSPLLPGLLLGLALAALVLGPGWRPGRLVGDEGLDVWAHAWGVGWVARCLTAGQLPWRVQELAWPDGGVLGYIDPLGALVALPLAALGRIAAGHTLALAAQVALAGAGGWAYGRALGGRGWVAGVGLATTPFLLCELYNGVSEAAWLGWIPVAGALAARGSPWAGAAVGLAFWATPYHGVSAGLLAATHLTLGPGTRPAQPARALGQMALVAVLVAAPAVGLLQAALSDPDALTRKPPAGDNWPVFRINAVDPVAFLRPGDFWSVPLSGPLEAPFRRTPYLGWGLLGLAGLGLARDRRHRPLLLPAGICATLALGPYLWHDGDFVRLGDGRYVALPFRALLTGTGVSMDHPLRFVGGALTALAGLADAALPARRARGWAVGAAAAVALEQLLVAPTVWPLPSADAALPDVYAALPADGAAVIDLPADRGDSMATNRYLYWSGLHHRGIPYAVKVGSQGFPSLNPALRTWTAAGRLTPLAPGAPGVPAPDADLGAAAAALAAQGYGYVVLHPELLARPDLLASHRAVLDPLLGAPEAVAGALVWRLRPAQ